MSWFSNIGKAIKKGVTDVGHEAGRFASRPIVQGAAGIFGGPLAGALVGAGGRLLRPGGNLGQAAQGALSGAASGALGGAARRLGSGILSGGLGGMIGRTSTMGRDQNDAYAHIVDYDEGGNPIYDTDLDAGSIMGGGGNGNGFSWGNLAKGAGRLLGSGLSGGHGGGGLGGLGGLAVGGLAGYQAYNAAQASKRSGELSDKALGLAESRWNEAAPLRTAGQARLLNPQRPDLSGVFSDPSNPFATRPAAPPMMPQQLPGGVGGLIRKLSAGGTS